MRKYLALLLLAGAATPALAAGAADERHGWQSHRDSSNETRSEDRSARSDRSDRPHFNRSQDNNGGDTERPRPALRVEARNGGDDAPRPVLRVESRNGGSDAPRPVLHVQATDG